MFCCRYVNLVSSGYGTLWQTIEEIKMSNFCRGCESFSEKVVGFDKRIKQFSFNTLKAKKV